MRGKAAFAAFLVFALCSVAGEAAARAQLDSGPWPMFHRDERHTGLSRYAGPQSSALSWSYVTGYLVEGSPSVLADGTVYIGSYDNNLYALSSTGLVLWSYTTGAYVFSCPALGVDGQLYVGSDDNVVYALESVGLFSWSYVTGAPVESSPAMGGTGSVYVASSDNNVYAFTSTGTLLWSFATGYWVKTSPALGPGERVYVTSDDFNIYALSSAGGFLWSYTTGAAATSEIAVGAGGVVFTGSNDGIVYALDSAGSLLWSYDAGLYGRSAPAVGANGGIYLGSFDGRLYVLTSGGSLAWTYRTGGGIVSGPAIGVDGRLYFGSEDCNVYALDSAGGLAWSFSTGGVVISSPAIGSGGQLYVGGSDAAVYCFRDPVVSAPLAVMKDSSGDCNLYGYEAPVAGDWTYWDAAARNPSPSARDLWKIPAGDNTIALTEVDADRAGDEELALLKAEQGRGDRNLYLYNAPAPGDWTYWDAISRNPSPVARDFWMIPSGNNAFLLADGESALAVMKDEGGDYNFYLYASPFPGDYVYWDAFSRNPSPLARDFWIIPQGDDASAMCGMDMTGNGESDSLLVVRNDGGNFLLYLWNMPEEGDWTYWDALSRNPSPLARDFWVVPGGGEIVDIAGIGDGFTDDLSVVEVYGGDQSFSLWNAPVPNDWTYWDASSRNPSPLARDFWMIPAGNDTVDVAAPDEVPKIGWAVGAQSDGYGTILYTDNGGAEWTRQGSTAEIPDSYLTDICAVNATTAWAVGISDGNLVIVHTEDGGRTWKRQGVSLGLSSNLYGISAVDPQCAWADGAEGTLLFTDDGGDTWELRNSGVGENAWFQAVSVVSENNVWAVGQNTDDESTMIFHTTDGGSTWSQQSLGGGITSKGLIDVSAVDVQNAFAGGVFAVLKTVNGGAQWTQIQSGTLHVNGVFALDANRVWTAQDYGVIYYSTDGGENWLQPESITGSNVQGFALMGVFFLEDGQHGWTVGRSLTPPFSEGIILYSSDGGKNWIEQDYPGDIGLRRVSFAGK